MKALLWRAADSPIGGCVAAAVAVAVVGRVTLLVFSVGTVGDCGVGSVEAGTIGVDNLT